MGLSELQVKISERIPNYLVCEASLCELDKICSLESYPDKDVYSRNVAIAANSEIYNPRQLKIFCWTKE